MTDTQLQVEQSATIQFLDTYEEEISTGLGLVIVTVVVAVVASTFLFQPESQISNLAVTTVEETTVQPEIVESDEAVIHTVQQGEGLWAIAEQYYGDGEAYAKIVAANEISNPEQLYTGMKLIIPELVSTDVSSEVDSTQDEPTAVTPGENYILAEGDSLASVALEAYGDSELWVFIWEANKDILPNPDILKVGLEIQIPTQ